MSDMSARRVLHDRVAEAPSFMEVVDHQRRTATRLLDPTRRGVMGQFLTPSPVATFMAGMFECEKSHIRLLDPGAGIGSLSAAFVAEMCARRKKPKTLSITAYELDPILLESLSRTLGSCRVRCDEVGIDFRFHVLGEDFIEAGARALSNDLLASGNGDEFDCAILNPPYRKIRAASRERRLLRKIGVETSNLYAGFLAVTIKLLASGGEMVAITPRSFCNGPYFEPFRRFLLRNLRFRRVHVFASRDRAFADDQVLQENVIFSARKERTSPARVLVSSSTDVDSRDTESRLVTHDDLVHPDDPHVFIHIVPNGDGESVRRLMAALEANLADLGLTVSTGRVVDFRAQELLRREPGRNTVPLIYPCHLRSGCVEWPKLGGKKPNALGSGPKAGELLVPAGFYVLVKRFSAKEEPRRVVAAVYDPARIEADRVAFENHLNYFHRGGEGMPPTLAKGLAAYLNSSLVDSYFRQFSGHTQVNATDLRKLRYPSKEKLVALGRRIGRSFPNQDAIDGLMKEIVLHGQATS